MMKTLSQAPRVLAAMLACAGAVNAQETVSPVAEDALRGELLYADHCVSCHTAQVHWRERRLTSDWTSLQFQVRRWQGVVGANWQQRDIDDVSRYLNERFYRYPEKVEPLSMR